MSDKVYTPCSFTAQQLAAGLADDAERVEQLTATCRLLRAALEHFARIEVPAAAADGAWVAETNYCNTQVTAFSVRKARAALEGREYLGLYGEHTPDSTEGE